MKSLVIAEKHNLAKTIVEALKLLNETFTTFKDNNSFYYESENYIVCAARGHLFTLCDVDDYLGLKLNWNLEQLPFFPKTFKWKPIEDADSYIQNIKKLLQRNDVNLVINAGDAAREGEFLIRLILQELGNKHPVKRLWMPTQVPADVKNQILSMKDDSEYDGLFNEGLARSIADWLDGINLTRYTTVRTGNFCRVGRVSTAIVKAIYDRDTEIKNFKPERYYKIVSNVDFLGSKLKLESNFEFELNEKQAAERLAAILNKTPCLVINIQSKERIVNPGKPFSQSKLQNFMNEKHHFSPDKTLEIAQKLYENNGKGGLITYPRTDSEYIEPGRIDSLERIIGRFHKEGYKVSLDPNDKIFDITKIEDHGAILPTIIFPKNDELTNDEQLEYDAIKNRFLAYFCSEKRIIEDTTVTLSFGEIDEIEITGHVVKNPGWAIYEEVTENDDNLPTFTVGQSIPVNFKVVECKTYPKKHYTVTTLNNYLENPLKKVKGNTEEAEEEAYKNLLDGCSIGTAASLAGILKKVISDELISLSGKNYKILPKGIYLIETLQKLNITIDENTTIAMNKYLKQIYLGRQKVSDYVEIVKENIRRIINNSKSIHLEQFNNTNYVGRCPRCGEPVAEHAKTFSCTNGNCKFVLLKEDKFWTSKKKTLTETMAAKFLAGKMVKVTKLYSESKKKYYDAYVEMTDDGFNTKFKVIFDKTDGKKANKKPVQYMS